MTLEGTGADLGPIIEAHLGLARAIARRFANRGEPYDDLVQVASMALVRAANSFDPVREVAFSTYATSMIIGELKHHFRDHGWQMKTPRRLQELYLELTGSVGELTQQLGRAPTVRELAQTARCREEDVIAALEAGRGYRADSLDSTAMDSPRVAQHTADRASGEEFEDRDELHIHLALLPEREQNILKRRFFDDQSQEQIASELGISQMHVSRLLRHGIEMLRHLYETP
jgi:RNA polymerase sigma-B factor